MPMKMGWRWYGEGNDPITLNDIKQIPGVTSIVWALHNKMPGEIWEIDEIQKVADQIHAYGFDMDVVESVNVHDDIKIGLPTRDKYIENYKQCIRNLSKFGVKVICYNFMPIFDWTRTDLFHPVGDGSTALFYQKDMIQDDYKAMADYITMADETVDVTDGITLFDPVETWKKRTFTNVRAERLNRPIYVNGKRVYENPPLRDIRDFCAAQVATLWDEVTRFENPHRYYVDLSQKLWDERQRLLTEFGR